MASEAQIHTRGKSKSVIGIWHNPSLKCVCVRVFVHVCMCVCVRSHAASRAHSQHSCGFMGLNGSIRPHKWTPLGPPPPRAPPPLSTRQRAAWQPLIHTASLSFLFIYFVFFAWRCLSVGHSLSAVSSQPIGRSAEIKASHWIWCEVQVETLNMKSSLWSSSSPLLLLLPTSSSSFSSTLLPSPSPRYMSGGAPECVW